MSKLRFTRWDTADYLKSDEDIAAYFEAALDDGDPDLIAVALGNIARARGMTRVARKAGLAPRNSSAAEGPSVETILRVIHALGIELHASMIVQPAPARRTRAKSSPRTAATRVSPTLART